MSDKELHPYPGEQWIPSNSDVGCGFLSEVCGKCARDRSIREGLPFDECDEDECCPIIARSFAGEAVEWRVFPDGSVHCMDFIPIGEVIPGRKCSKTDDMFSDISTV